MPREYEADCASLEIEFFGGHNALRCLHVRHTYHWYEKMLIYTPSVTKMASEASGECFSAS
jgi:hypothetical protein